MARVIITSDLKNEILAKFKGESKKIFRLMNSLGENPKKGKVVGQLEGIVIKELKYRNFRFYFVTDGHKIKFLEISKLKDLIIKFVRMSDKKSQQKVIEEIKDILRKFDKEGF